MGRWWWAWAGVLAVVVAGAQLDVMEADAAQYAEMSRQLALDGDWLHFHWRGNDYLDKPPLLFWLSALSFKVFGVHNWSYKLPSILFAFAGVLALFRFVRRSHPVDIAHTAALLFATSAAFTLMTNDVRCDTLLTACIVIAIEQGDAYQRGRSWRHLIGCAAALGLGLLAKGPIGLVAPLLALLPPLLIARRWKALVDPRVLVAPLVLAALLLPMCIGLYEQHGAHGLRFFFWEQSFGRITGENRWKDDSSPFYFAHEVLWLLLPWTLPALAGLWRDLRTWRSGGPSALPELASLCGALGIFLAMSFSQYKLPHYIYPAIPLVCVIAARELHRDGTRWMSAVQNGLALLLIALAGAVAVVCPGGEGAMAWVLPAAIGLSMAVVAWVRGSGAARIVAPGGVAAITTALVLHLGIYPFLLGYQSNAQAGHAVQRLNADPGMVAGFRNGGAALDLYTGTEVPWFDAAADVLPYTVPGGVVFTDPEGMRQLEVMAPRPRLVKTFDDYPVQQLSPGFLLPGRREKLVQQRVLLFY